MKKRIISEKKFLGFSFMPIALAALILSSCGKSIDHKDVEAANFLLVEKYNQVAQLAFDNGWNSDSGMVTKFGDIEALVEEVNDIMMEGRKLNKEEASEFLERIEAAKTSLETEIEPIVKKEFASAGGGIVHPEGDENGGDANGSEGSGS